MDVQVRGLLALGLEVMFLVVVIGVRMALQVRWTGSSGFKLHKFVTTGLEGFVTMTLAFAVGALAVVTGAALTDSGSGGPESVSPTVVAIAVLLGLIAIATTFWSQIAMGASWRIGVDVDESTALVTTGPFRWVRNPIYTSMLVFFGALVGLLPNVLSAAAFVGGLAGIEVVVRAVEEPFLFRRHGDAYAEWFADSGRFVPAIKPRAGERPGA